MAIETLDIVQFRNLSHIELTVSPQLTLIVGQNGQGKTNLLESVYLLLQGQDYRTANEREVIQKGQEWASLRATGTLSERSQQWHHRVPQLPMRKVHQGPIVPTVMFSPDDVYLAKGSPARRRRFLDLLLGSHDSRYQRSLRSYQRVLLQRNRALKEASYQSVVDDFTPIMVREGWHLWQRRQEVLTALQPQIVAIHHTIAPQETLSLTLKQGGAAEQVQSEDHYAAIIRHRIQEERQRQVSLVGPHRDDVLIFINEMDTTLFASQGQLRTVALSIKLATYEWLFRETGLRPVILLDDVLSELDDVRRSAILKAVSQPNQQTLVTDTEPRNFRLLDPLIVGIKEGSVVPWNLAKTD